MTILFLHGWGGNADSFAPISGYFAREHTVLTPALACPPATVYTLDDYAAEVLDYLRARNVTQCAVVAHSFGARLVALLNAQHPGLFTHIVITGGAGIPPRWSLATWLKIRWHKIKRRLGLPAHGGSADYRHLSPNGKITFQNVIHRDLSAEIRTITAPTTLIWGSRDSATPPEMFRRWQRLIPHAQARLYQGAGHFAYLEQPARFIRDVAHALGVA